MVPAGALPSSSTGTSSKSQPWATKTDTQKIATRTRYAEAEWKRMFATGAPAEKWDGDRSTLQTRTSSSWDVQSRASSQHLSWGAHPSRTATSKSPMPTPARGDQGFPTNTSTSAIDSSTLTVPTDSDEPALTVKIPHRPLENTNDQLEQYQHEDPNNPPFQSTDPWGRWYIRPGSTWRPEKDF